MNLPNELRNVIECSRKVAQAHVALQRAIADEASERVLKQKARTRHTALEELVKHVVAFEKMLAAAKSAKGRAGFDWTGFFRATKAAVDLVASARRGDPDTVQKARDFIDAEIVD